MVAVLVEYIRSLNQFEIEVEVRNNTLRLLLSCSSELIYNVQHWISYLSAFIPTCPVGMRSGKLFAN